MGEDEHFRGRALMLRQSDASELNAEIFSESSRDRKVDCIAEC